MEFKHVLPEEVGIHSSDIVRFIRKEHDAGVELHSFMLIRHGKVAAQAWAPPYSPDAKHIIYSFSKTFTATAIGFAEQEGILRLDEKLVDIFPDELPEEISENLALADIESLLTMSCGHEAGIEKEDINAHGNNWVKAFFAQPFKYRPHTMFQYNTYGTDLLCLILLKRTGLSLMEFLKPRLFDPLGIEDIYCSRMGDRQVSLDDPYGEVEGGGWGVHARTEDLARFVWFLEQRGVWDGKRLLRDEWFDRAVTKRIETENEVYGPAKSNWMKGYCYQCWCNDLPGTYRCDGAYGQFGYVLPDKDAILVMTAASVNTQEQLNIFTETIAEHMEDGPVEADPAAVKELEAACSSMKCSCEWAIRQPWSEERLSGIGFQIDNPRGVSFEEFIDGEGHFAHDGLRLETMHFFFDNDQLRICFDESTQESPDKISQTLYVGLDGNYRSSDLSDGIYYASGKWTAQDEMQLDVRFFEALGSAKITLSISPDALRLCVRSQIPEENPLTHRAFTELRSGKVI